MVLTGPESSGSDIQEKPDRRHRCGLNGSPHEVRSCTGFVVVIFVLFWIDGHNTNEHSSVLFSILN